MLFKTSFLESHSMASPCVCPAEKLASVPQKGTLTLPKLLISSGGEPQQSREF